MTHWELVERLRDNDIIMSGDAAGLSPAYHGRVSGRGVGVDVREGLLAGLYGSVLEPDTFLPTLTRINRWLDCDGVHVIGLDRAVSQVLVSMVVGDHLRDAEDLYRRHYRSIDPRTSLSAASSPGVLIACHDYFDDKYVRRSEFYQDFLIPHGPRYVMGGNIFHEGPRDIMIAFNHLVGRPEFSKAKKARVNALLPHFMKWAQMMMQAGKLRAAMSAGAHSLQILDQGVIALDKQLRVVYANPVADSILGLGLIRRGLGLQASHGLDTEHRIKRVHATRQSECFMAIHAKGGRMTSLFVNAFAVSREGTGDHRAPLDMQGLSGVSSLGNPGESLFHGLSRPNVIILLRKVGEAKPMGAEHLRPLFGLTPAEAHLAEALAQGVSVTDYADRNKVSINTVRTQVRALLSKTGAKNLRDMVRSLAGLPGMAAAKSWRRTVE